jgi:hypothetical protein
MEYFRLVIPLEGGRKMGRKILREGINNDENVLPDRDHGSGVFAGVRTGTRTRRDERASG